MSGLRRILAKPDAGQVIVQVVGSPGVLSLHALEIMQFGDEFSGLNDKGPEHS